MDIYIEGSGKSINSIFGERFLKVDEEIIELKKRVESKSIYWDNIESIKSSTSKVLINSKENDKTEIKYLRIIYPSKILSKIRNYNSKLHLHYTRLELVKNIYYHYF